MTSTNGHVREPAGVARKGWPVSFGMPFSKGELQPPGNVRIWGPDRQPLPVHTSVRARWPDGSLKWILVDTQISMEPMAVAELPIEFGSSVDAIDFDSDLNCRETDDSIEIDTGPLQVTIARSGATLFPNITWNGIEVGRNRSSSELTATDAAGVGFDGHIDSAEVEERGPLRLVVLLKGQYLAAGASPFMSWLARIHFYDGQSFVKLYHTFVQDAAAQTLDLRRLTIRLNPEFDGKIAAALGSRSTQSPHGFVFGDLTTPVSLSQQTIGRHVLDDGSPTRHDGNAHGWVSVGDRSASVTMKLRRPWQNYPKAYRASKEEISIDLYPGLPAPSQVEEPAFGNQSGPVYDGPLRVPQGMAKTHELYIQIGARQNDARAIDYHMLGLEQPLLLHLPSEYYAGTGVFGPLPPLSDRYWPLELKLRELCAPPGGLGILDCGDEVRLRMVDGKLETRTTDNLAYDLPSSLLRQYVRTGDQHLLAEAEAAVFHLMDVDTVHFDATHPEWIGGPRCAWSQNHHYTTAAAEALAGPRVSHAWLGGMLDYYFITGYRRALDVAESCADYCRRSAPYKWKEKLTGEARNALEPDQDWPFNARDVGWALTAMGTYFNSFPEERFLRAMEALVDLAERWQDGDGRWRQSIGSFNRGSDPSASAAILHGLQLYHEATGDRRAYEVLLRGVSFLVHHGRTIEGLFFCYESPVADRPHAPAAELFSVLVFAFESTGDTKILDAGFRFFRWLLESGEAKPCMLKEIFSIIPLLDRTNLLESYRGPDVAGESGDRGWQREDS